MMPSVKGATNWLQLKALTTSQITTLCCALCFLFRSLIKSHAPAHCRVGVGFRACMHKLVEKPNEFTIE